MIRSEKSPLYFLGKGIANNLIVLWRFLYIGNMLKSCLYRVLKSMCKMIIKLFNFKSSNEYSPVLKLGRG